MKKLYAALTALAFGLLTQAAHAEVISLGSLSYSNNANPAQEWEFGPTARNDILIDFKFSYTGALQDNDFAVFYFGNYLGPNIGLKANCDGGCTGQSNDLFVRLAGTGWTEVNYLRPLNAIAGESYHLTGRLSKQGASTNYNRFDLWYTPEGSNVATLAAYANGNSGFSSFDKFGIRTANLDAGDTVYFDDVTITAVPEPGTISLIGLAVAGIAVTRRRKSRQTV